MLRAAALALALILGPPAQAQDLIAQYTAFIGPQDLRGAQGERLRHPADVLAQDRANFHARAIRQFADETDPVFTTRAARAQMHALLGAGGISPQAAEAIRHGGRIVHVQVWEVERTLQSVTVTATRP